jgi:hypothetical protein
MNAESASLDHVSIRTYLRIDAAAGDDAYRVTIQVSDLGIVVEAVDRQVGAAIQTAAQRCAEELGDRGYLVTAGEVLDSLETLDGEGSPDVGVS